MTQAQRKASNAANGANKSHQYKWENVEESNEIAWFDKIGISALDGRVAPCKGESDDVPNKCCNAISNSCKRISSWQNSSYLMFPVFQWFDGSNSNDADHHSNNRYDESKLEPVRVLRSYVNLVWRYLKRCCIRTNGW